MRPTPDYTTAEYILTPNATALRTQQGTQPVRWWLRFFGEELISFDEHPAGGPVLGDSDKLAQEVARELAGDSGADYRQTARQAVDALVRFAQDISADD